MSPLGPAGGVLAAVFCEFGNFVKLKPQEKNNGGCENHPCFSRCPTKMSGFSLLELKITGIEARTLGISSRWEWVNISGYFRDAPRTNFGDSNQSQTVIVWAVCVIIFGAGKADEIR